MEHFLVALDDTPGSLKSVHYINRVLMGVRHIQLTLFHVLDTVSPNLLKREEVQRIERIHEEQPHLSGYFWTTENEEKMLETFHEAKLLLLEGGFPEEQIKTHFSVHSADVAHVILREAETLKCSTIVLGRRGLGRVKEFFLGSVSNTVTKFAREMTVWVVDG
ncbi:MAG: universal stress protein [Desulforhabdus sp.]|jgi:nucleotide-binding universal stress UspA family protein|nr:universal stress protein [Desulforhabdus sp.]